MGDRTAGGMGDRTAGEMGDRTAGGMGDRTAGTAGGTVSRNYPIMQWTLVCPHCSGLWYHNCYVPPTVPPAVLSPIPPAVLSPDYF